MRTREPLAMRLEGAAEAPSKRKALPQTRIGWCGLALLLVVAAFPAYFQALGSVLHNDRVTALLALGSSAFVVSGIAIFVRKDRSVLLVALFVIVLIAAAFIGLLFLAMGLGEGR